MKRLTLQTRTPQHTQNTGVPAALTPLLRRPRLALACALLLLSGTVLAAGPTGLLNDTGQTQCYDGSAMVACTQSNTGDTATNPRQDGRFGRDPAAPAKVDGGAAGFDFTKVCFNGALEGANTCTGTLTANGTGVASNTPATDWACTKDNVTNLIWSLQSGNGDWNTYASTTLPNATNTTSRCGFNSGWRLPTQRELLSIVHNGLASGPMVDTLYFPGTLSDFYWTSDSYAPNPGDAWVVYFGNGNTDADYKTLIGYGRLVRSGQ